MHPTIKLISLIVVSILVTQGGWITLLLTGVFMLPFYILHLNLWQSVLKMFYKLKWFFLSILLVYLFFTPNYSESHAGIKFLELLLPGLFRISILVCILFAVNLYIRTSSKEQILSALLWLLSPLKWFKIDIERISLRAVLTLEYIEILTLRMADYKASQSHTEPEDNQLVSQQYFSVQYLPDRIKSYFQKKKSVFFHLINQSGIILRDILDEAEKTSGKSYKIECLPNPVLIQFAFPAIIFLLLFLTL